MYIKEVIIEGFKSFKEKTVLGPFHPNLNVLVGANGSGKTNILYAIQFVVTDEFSYLKQDIRQSLIFRGSGHHNVSASVNIIFNNSDRRIPVETAEVSICRTIGDTFDQFYINGKQISRKEMKNILIAAGFSTCNPYYTVKQGKVCELATATDIHRLNILLEAFGDQDFEENVNKSETTLKENVLKFERAKSLLNNLDEKLKLFEKEKDSIKEFNELQRTKKAMKACLYERDIAEMERDLIAVEESFSTIQSSRNEYRASQQHIFEEIEKTNIFLEKTEKKLKELKNKEDKLQRERLVLQAEVDEMMSEVRTLKDIETKNAKQKVYLENKIQELNIQMADNEETLKEIKSQSEEMETKEKENSRSIEEMKQKREELFDKLGRCSQFTSKVERDAWLQNELRLIQETSSDVIIKKNSLEKVVREDKEKIKKLESEMEDLKNNINQWQLRVDEMEEYLSNLLKKRSEEQSVLRELFQEEAFCEQKLSSLKDDLAKARSTLYSVAHKNSIAGLEGLEKVLKMLQESGDDTVEGYYGMVIDVLDCDNSLFRAVEVTAGKRLFYHIVADEKISVKLLKEFNRNHFHGEVNFFLLNQLRTKQYEYPESRDAIPLIRKLHFDEIYNKVIVYIFGKTLICRNIETALQFADEKNFDCITLHGDQVLKSGMMFGGYHDKKESAISMYKNVTSLQKEIKEMERKTSILQEKLSHSKSEILKCSNKKQSVEQRLGTTKSEIEQYNSTKRLLNEELNVWKEFKLKNEELINKYQADLDLLETHTSNLKQELNQEMAFELSEPEQRTLHELNDDIRRLTEDCKNILKIKQQLDYNGEFLKKNNYIELHEHLVQELNELNKDKLTKKLETISETLDASIQKMESIQTQLMDIEKALTKTMKVKKLTLEKCITQSAELGIVEQQMEEYRKDIDKFVTKKNSLLDRIEECKQNIKELGPTREQHKYQNMQTKNIKIQLAEVNRKLRRFPNLNMRAEHQYDQLLEDQEAGQDRLDHLENEQRQIITLKDNLKTGRNGKIIYTLKETAHNFQRIFKKLVPNGNAELVMKNSDNEPISYERIQDVSIIKGIGVRVCFDMEVPEFQNFRECSEGQKALIALTFITSLQKFCETPFYLFDEVDSMLDNVYKPKLAEMLGEFSKEAQYIVIAHSPTLVNYADQHFGVSYGNEVSHVQVLSKDRALQVVTH